MSFKLTQTMCERCSCMVCVSIACVTRAVALSQQGDTIEQVGAARLERARHGDPQGCAPVAPVAPPVAQEEEPLERWRHGGDPPQFRQSIGPPQEEDVGAWPPTRYEVPVPPPTGRRWAETTSGAFGAYLNSTFKVMFRK
ncbi:unnamed protein product, partial [Prorocentrum cordatum]